MRKHRSDQRLTPKIAKRHTIRLCLITNQVNYPKSFKRSYESDRHDLIYIDMIEINAIKNFNLNNAIKNSETTKAKLLDLIIFYICRNEYFLY